MKLFALADLHGSEAILKKMVKSTAMRGADCILVAGDVAVNDLASARGLLKLIGSLGKPAFFVPGNMDSPALASIEEVDGVKCLHGKRARLGEFSVVGVGGGPSSFLSTPFELPESELKRLLEEAFSGLESGKFILLSHAPPKNTKLDKVSSGLHVGSSSIRKFVEEREPALAVSGHIHEARGVDKVGKTLLVNPGPAFRGFYALIEVGQEIKASLSKL